MVATNIYFSYTMWYFKENMLASMWPPVGLKITGVSTQGGQFCRLEPSCKDTGFSFWQAALSLNPKTASPCTYPIILFSIIFQALSLWPEPFCAGNTFAAAASALDCKCKPKFPALFLFFWGEGDEFKRRRKVFDHSWKSYSYIWIGQQSFELLH